MVFQGSQVLPKSILGEDGVVHETVFLFAEQSSLNGCKSQHSQLAQCNCKKAFKITHQCENDHTSEA